jgi:hypothetical protein
MVAAWRSSLQGRSYAHGLELLGLVAAMALATIWLGPSGPFTLWVAYMALLFAFVSVVGHWITKRWLGYLIDERNKLGLGRFQLALWTVLILPAVAAAAISNVYAGAAHPLDLHIPQQIWFVLGISTTSLVAAPLLLTPKTQQPPTADQLGLLGPPDNNGLIVANLTVNDASWSDLFMGEEVGNFAYVDMAKVQMFFFTLILVAIYGAALGNLFYGRTAVTAFPDFDSSMAALLAISHAGYLANKAVPHTPA